MRGILRTNRSVGDGRSSVIARLRLLGGRTSVPGRNECQTLSRVIAAGGEINAEAVHPDHARSTLGNLDRFAHLKSDNVARGQWTTDAPRDAANISQGAGAAPHSRSIDGLRPVSLLQR